MLIRKIEKVEANASESSSSEDNENQGPKKKKQIFDSVRALIISPTRELAIQIKDMIQAVIPMDY
jgi:superfamily II DNA/RNA helicase